MLNWNNTILTRDAKEKFQEFRKGLLEWFWISIIFVVNLWFGIVMLYSTTTPGTTNDFVLILSSIISILGSIIAAVVLLVWIAD
jgi:hypothetical protein